MCAVCICMYWCDGDDVVDNDNDYDDDDDDDCVSLSQLALSCILYMRNCFGWIHLYGYRFFTSFRTIIISIDTRKKKAHTTTRTVQFIFIFRFRSYGWLEKEKRAFSQKEDFHIIVVANIYCIQPRIYYNFGVFIRFCWCRWHFLALAPCCFYISFDCLLFILFFLCRLPIYFGAFCLWKSEK